MLSQGSIIGKKYTILELIGRGKFGTVYKGVNKKNEKIAIKIEDAAAVVKILKTEAAILNYLYRNNCRYIPSVHWFGVFLDRATLVMTYYNYSLQDYIEKTNARSIDKMNKMMIVLLNIIKSIHELFVIHRDIKPQNFMMKDESLYLIDFGMATMYVDEDRQHIPEKTGKTDIIGTPKYISPNIHNGCEPSRRDDVISLCYIYLQMWLGYLPWDNNHISGDMVDRKLLKSWEKIEPIAIEIGEPFLSFIKKQYSIEFKISPEYAFS